MAVTKTEKKAKDTTAVGKNKKTESEDNKKPSSSNKTSAKKGTTSEQKNSKETTAKKQGAAKKAPVANKTEAAATSKPTSGGRGVKGRGKGRRKPRISPEELRRRQVKEWLTVSDSILGLKAYQGPPEMPYFMQRELEFIKAREHALREREIGETMERMKKRQEESRKAHFKTINQRHRTLCRKNFEKALAGEQKVMQHIRKIEEERAAKELARQFKIYQDRMLDIKLSEQMKRLQLLNRQDEARVYRLLKKKFELKD